MQFEERKRKRRCQHDCRDHIFSLQTQKSNSSKYDIKVQFCPKFQRDPLPAEHTFPVFNDDDRYFTSAFILGVDKRMLLKNEQQELMDHQKQIRDSLEKQNQLVFPRPNSKHSWCSVCKEHYKNYYYHIGSEEHRERIGLSSYNNHIYEVCSIYIHFWEGCEVKADEAAERRAIQDEERRLRFVEIASVEEEEEEYSNSLADCDRGSPDEDQFDENGDPLLFNKPPKIKRKVSSRNYEDTVPMGRKRSNPDGRSAYEPTMRKHMLQNQANSIHTARERKERNYERERVKMMKGTEWQKFKKDYVEMNGFQDDAFLILKPSQAIQGKSDIVDKLELERTIKKEVVEEKKESNEIVILEGDQYMPSSSSASLDLGLPEDEEAQEVEEVEEVEELVIKESEDLMERKSIEEGQLEQFSESSDNSDDFFSRKTERVKRKEPEYRHQVPAGDKGEGKVDPRLIQGYNLPYTVPMPSSHPPPPDQLSQAYKAEMERYKISGGSELPPNERYKGQQGQQGHPEGYKGMPPNYYYPPYGYPPIYDPDYSLAQEKGYEGTGSLDKEKGKGQQKTPYDYSNAYPPSWSYPYYMPPMNHPQSNADARIDPSQTPPSQKHPSQHPPQPHPSQKQHSQQHPPQPHPSQKHPSQLPPREQSQAGHPPSSSGKNTGGNPNSPYVGNTSININFPMYMCPPHPSMQGGPYGMQQSRYPMPSMMNHYGGYQYPYGSQHDIKGEGDYEERMRTGNQTQPPYSHGGSQHHPPLPPPPSSGASHERYGPIQTHGQGSNQSGHQGGRSHQGHQSGSGSGSGHQGHQSSHQSGHQGRQGNHQGSHQGGHKSGQMPRGQGNNPYFYPSSSNYVQYHRGYPSKQAKPTVKKEP